MAGGPRSLHQLCGALNRHGADAYVFYFPECQSDNLYPDVTHVRIATRIPDGPGNLVIIPEVFRIAWFRARLPESTIAIYWLSFFYAGLAGVLQDNLNCVDDAVHLFHSYYEYAMIRPHLPPSVRYFMIDGTIGDDFLALDPEAYHDGKKDIVCSNGRKDITTAVVCADAGIECIAIDGMSTAEVMQTMQRCKAYVDLGFFPGIERMPREAAMNGCVVITNKCGSAAYTECLPIEEKVSRESELNGLIPAVFADYEGYFAKQAPFRDFVRGQKSRFERNVHDLLEAMAGGN